MRQVEHVDGASTVPHAKEPASNGSPPGLATPEARSSSPLSTGDWLPVGNIARVRSRHIDGRGWIAICCAVIAVAAAGAAVFSHRNGSQWQEHAHTAEAHAQDLDMRLTKSEADRQALEHRIDALASEKANAQDSQAVAEQQTQTATELATLATTAAADQRVCRSALDTLLRATLDAFSIGGGLSYAASLAGTADQTCGQADVSFNRLVSGVNALRD